MTKTRGLITENLKLVDAVIELLDSRIPASSQNPDIDKLVRLKPRIIIMNKFDIANAFATAEWVERFKSEGLQALAVDSISGKGFNKIKGVIDFALNDKIRRDFERGMKKRPQRLMIVGIPNVGKSSFINRLAGRASAKTGDRPGITRAKQWITLSGNYALLDTPGILWPKFDEGTGLSLAFTGAIRDDVFDITDIACRLCAFLAAKYPENLRGRYKLKDISNMSGYEVLSEIGSKRGCLVSGGEIDLRRAGGILLDEFRAGLLGKITLEHASKGGNRNE